MTRVASHTTARQRRGNNAVVALSRATVAEPRSASRSNASSKSGSTASLEPVLLVKVATGHQSRRACVRDCGAQATLATPTCGTTSGGGWALDSRYVVCQCGVATGALDSTPEAAKSLAIWLFFRAGRVALGFVAKTTSHSWTGFGKAMPELNSSTGVSWPNGTRRLAGAPGYSRIPHPIRQFVAIWCQHHVQRTRRLAPKSFQNPQNPLLNLRWRKIASNLALGHFSRDGAVLASGRDGNGSGCLREADGQRRCPPVERNVQVERCRRRHLNQRGLGTSVEWVFAANLGGISHVRVRRAFSRR
uniref:Uncharacterized protein n=1 Tax=Mycena chlorophos TaxID=658473 RepID=A0ABQ0KX33_MYCCL|nr:predicted protein [Mycena chlorophos]